MELLFVTAARGVLVFVGGAAGPLAKALSHKYLKRVPYTTRDGKRRYRYWYKLPGGGIAQKDQLVAGSAFKVEGGHYHVTATDADGGKVTVKHDETGKEATLSHDALVALLHEEHKGKIAERGARLRQTLTEAEKAGNKKLIAARRRDLAAHEAAYERKPKPEPKAEPKPEPKAEPKPKAKRQPRGKSTGAEGETPRQSGKAASPDARWIDEDPTRRQTLLILARGYVEHGSAARGSMFGRGKNALSFEVKNVRDLVDKGWATKENAGESNAIVRLTAKGIGALRRSGILGEVESEYGESAERNAQDAAAMDDVYGRKPRVPARTSPDQITADEQRQREEAAAESARRRRKPGGDEPATTKAAADDDDAAAEADFQREMEAAKEREQQQDAKYNALFDTYRGDDAAAIDAYYSRDVNKIGPATRAIQARAQELLPGVRMQDAAAVVAEAANGKTPGKLSPEFVARMQAEGRVRAGSAKAAQTVVDAAHAAAPPDVFKNPSRRTVRSTARRLQEPISKATGAAPADARAFVAETLAKKTWQPDGRAALVGAALGADGAHVVENRGAVSQGAESLGGFAPGAADVVEAVDLHNGAESGKVAKDADPSLALLAAALRAAENNPEAAAGALRKLLSSPALDRVARMALAYPGVDADRTVAAVPAMVAKAEATIPHAPRTEGASRTVYFPGPGGKPVGLPGKYRLITVSDAVTSHDAATFAVNKAYPEGWQTRVYHTDKGEQDKVNRNVDNMIPSFTVNTNPDGVNGPPVMLANGVVMGGNSRTMSIRKAYDTGHKSAEAYRTFLRENAAQFGFSPADVDAVKNPILVREVDTGAMGPAEMKLFVQNLNEGFTQSMDPRTMAVAMSRKVSERALETLATELEDDETLSDFLASPRSSAFIDGLYSGGVIDDRNESAYIRKGTRRVNEQGKALVESILVGKMVGDPNILRDVRPSMMSALARSVPHMIRATAGGDGYDLREPLRHALSAYNEFVRLADTKAVRVLPDAKWKPEEIDKFIDNALTGRIVEDHPAATDPRARAILTAMFTQGGSVQMARVFKKYADMAKRNPENQDVSEALAGRRRTPAEVFRIAIQGAADEQEPKQEGFGFARDAGELYSGAELLRMFATRQRPRRM